MVASLVAAAVLSRTNPAQAFFFTPLRAWELLLGAIVALDIVPAFIRFASLSAGAGLAMIAVSFFHAAGDAPPLGLVGLAPCVGTALLLHAGRQESTATNHALSHPVPVWIGKRSYGLYLWHWPVLVFGELLAMRALTGFEVVGLCALSVAIAAASYRFLEEPARRGRRDLNASRVLAYGVLATSVVAILGVTTNLSRSTLVALQSTIVGDFPLLTPGPNRDNMPKKFGLWGDSHVEALSEGLELSRLRGEVAVNFRAGCPPIVDIDVARGRLGTKNDCFGHNDQALQMILRSSSTTVLLAARWGLYAEGTRFGAETGPPVYLCDRAHCAQAVDENFAILRAALLETISRLRNGGKQVVLIASIPEVGIQVDTVLRISRLLGHATPPGVSLTSFLARQRRTFGLLAELSESGLARVLYPHTALCQESCSYLHGSLPIYSDNNHVNARGALLIWNALAESLVGMTNAH